VETINAYNILVVKPKKKRKVLLGRPGVDGRIILKWAFKK
jgi:hypothetical protein